MHHFFIRLYHLISKNKGISVVIAFVLLLALGFFTSKIRFEEDITRIIPKNDSADVTAKVLKQLNFSDKITVLIEKNNDASIDDMSEMATVFLDSIASLEPYIKNVQGKVDEENIKETFDFVYQNLPLFLEDADYQVIQNKLQKDSLSEIVQRNYRTLISPTGIIAKDFIINDPLGISFIALKKLQQLNIGNAFELENGFVVTKDKTKLLLFINPKLSGSETKKNEVFVDKLKNIQTQINQQFKGKVTLDYFGSSFIAVANAKQIKSDITKTVLISMSVLLLILIFFYRKISIPIIIFIPTVFGVLFALASLYFIKDAISAISLSVGAVLLGITIDYSLHILTHYKHNSDIEQLYKDITKPLIMSSATTAISFLCLLFVNSEALKDLGIFAAISVIIAAFASLIIIPHLYKHKSSETIEKHTFLDKMGAFSFEKNKFLLISSIIVIIVSFFTFSKVSFNNNLSDLNFVPKEIQEVESKLESATNLTSKSIYLASYGNSMEEVLEYNTELFSNLKNDKKEQKILNFSSIGGIVLSKKEQQERIQKWNSFWNQENKDFLRSNLILSGKEIGFKPETHQNFYNVLDKKFETISFEDYEKMKVLFLDEFVTNKEGFYTISSVVKVSNQQRDAFVNQISKEKEVIAIDRQHMNETFLGKLKDDFNSLVSYSLIAVFLILLFFFRRIELVIISMIPILLTGIVTLGIMSVFDIELNIFSTIVCTLIFGHGVDFSIFMTSALQKEYTYGKSELNTYRTSILLAVITTILAIGALIFAKHPALKSISSVSLIGVFSALIITFVFYPILYKIFISNRVKKGKSPITFRLFFHGTVSFIYYGLGGFLLSIIGEIVMKIVPFSKEKKMVWFRKTMSKFMDSVMFSNPFVSKKVVNTFQEKFEKPAIIIANHTSFLDTLVIGMLHHKIIFLVNDWVYNSPFFGRAVKLAGFYPVSQGLEGGVEHLREKVKEGFSLVVFPEGTRSDDNMVRRFHKGAFYLAAEFQLDILPIYIHGNHEALPKGDHIIYDENVTITIEKRIAIDDNSFGNNYTERTKKISVFFKEKYQKLRNELEGEDYFKNKLFLSYLYKENEIVSRNKSYFIERKKMYFELNKEIPIDAKILHLTNDYGQLDHMLTLQQPKRKIQSFITNSENRGEAKSNYIVVKRNIVYHEEMNVIEQKYGVLILSNTKLSASIQLKYAENCDIIILIDTFELQVKLENLGFKMIQNHSGFMILKR